MNLTPKTAAVLVVLGLLIPAGAVFGTAALPTDGLFDGDGEPEVRMEAHDGPAGQYVAVDDGGQLEVDFTGVNRETLFEYHRVFDLVNDDDRNVTVWVEHENEGVIRLYDDATGQSVEGRGNAVDLESGQRMVVSIDIDSRGSVSHDALRTGVIVHAEYEPALPFFAVDIVDYDDTVEEGETITLEADVENTGHAGGTQSVEFLVGGELVDSTEIELAADESGTVGFGYETDGSHVGQRELTVRTNDDNETRTVTVQSADEPFFAVGIVDSPENVTSGEPFDVEVTVENVGNETATQTVALDVDDRLADSVDVELAPGERRTVTLTGETEPRPDAERVPIAVRSDDDEATADVLAESALVASASADSYVVEVGTSVQLRASGSIVPVDADPTYEWTVDGDDVGDGELIDAVLEEPGEREVTLTVTADGETDTDSFTITVEDTDAPTAVLDVPDAVGVDESFELDATRSTDNVGIASYEWEFGDGATGSLPTPSHSYDEAGRYTVTLTVTDTSGNTDTTSREVVVEGPRASLSADELDFGETSTNGAGRQTVRISNDGTAPLDVSRAEITGTDANAFEHTAEGEFLVQPGETRSVPVEFSPTEAGAHEATLEIDSDNPTALGPISLTGTGVESAVAPTDRSVDFGDVSVGDRQERSVTIENVGDVNGDVASAEIVGSSAFEIVDDGGLPEELEPGERHGVTVAFDPGGNGDDGATLRFAVGDDERTSVSLRGTGQAPEIRLSPDDDLVFPTVGVGDRTRTTVEVSNHGAEPLDIEDVRIVGDGGNAFDLVAETLPDSIDPGGSDAFELRFSPEADGDHEAEIEIESNDPARPVASLPVTGPAVGAEIGIDRRTVDFGEVNVGETVVMDVTVRNKNSSIADLTIESSDIVGPDHDSFEIVGGEPPVTLAPGESHTFELEFEPLTAGKKESQLRILSDAGNRPLINVWLSNTRTYILVQEVGNPTVNVEGYNLVADDSHAVNVWMPRTDGEAIGFEELHFDTLRSGNFEMNVNHDTDPRGPTYEPEEGTEPIQYVEIDHVVGESGSTYGNTSIVYQLSKESVPEGAEPEDVTLHRYSDDTGEWVDVSATAQFLEETDDHYHYRIETPGFSQFVATAPVADDEDDPEPSDPDGSGAEPRDPPADEADDESGIDVDVEFDTDEQPPTETSPVSDDEIAEMDRETVGEPPRAIVDIDAGADRQLEIEGERSVTVGDEQYAVGADTAVAIAGDPAAISGARSTVSSRAAVAAEETLVEAVRVDVPDEFRGEPATVRFSIDRDRIDSPTDAAVGHRTDDGWQLLPTTVVEETDDRVVFEVRTSSVSVFGVFERSDVTYEWEISEGSTAEEIEFTHVFESPGLYDVDLTVTDAGGQQSAERRQVLANDEPTVDVELVNQTDNGTVTLRANVDNEVGETTTTWTFPDGTELVGEVVTTQLDAGDHEVGVVVEDEFGARTEVDSVVGVGPDRTIVEEALDMFGLGTAVLWQSGLALLVLLGGAVVYRRAPWVLLGRGERPEPRITRIEDPLVEPGAGRLLIGAIRAEAPRSELESVTIELRDGDEQLLLRKAIEIGSGSRYSALREEVVAPPGVRLAADETYTLRVTATNEHDLVDEREIAAIPLSTD